MTSSPLASLSLGDEMVPHLANGVRLRHDAVRDCSILLGPEKLVSLDDVAAAIVGRLDGVQSFGEIVRDLSATFDASADTIRTDVAALLLQLRAGGLVRW